MPEYSFNFNIVMTGVLKITIMKLGLIFNKEAIQILGSPAKINIGYDTKNKALAIRPAVDSIEIKSYDFAKKGDETWIRVNCKTLVKAIEASTKINFDTSKSYQATFDEDSNMLIVELSKKQ